MKEMRRIEPEDLARLTPGSRLRILTESDDGTYRSTTEGVIHTTPSLSTSGMYSFVFKSGSGAGPTRSLRRDSLRQSIFHTDWEPTWKIEGLTYYQVRVLLEDHRADDNLFNNGTVVMPLQGNLTGAKLVKE